ncbi:MAG: outer membrane beta-barrel domain-containing protein [Myxococcota bacterium]
MKFLIENQEVTPTLLPKSPLRWTVMLLAVCAVMFTGATAMAADGDEKVKERLDEYWSSERDLPSLEERMYDREGKVSVGAFAGVLSSEPFFWYVPVGLRAGYHFTNEYGIEVEGSFMDAEGLLHHQTSLSDFLTTSRGDSFDLATDTEDRFKWRAHAMFMWHPLYGKLAVLQRKLSHFDFNLGIGAGAVSVQRPNATRTDFETTIQPEVVLGGGVQFFATEALTLRLEGRGYIYQGAETPTAQSFGERLQVPTEFLAGVGYTF